MNCALNLLGPDSDRHQISPHSVTTSPNSRTDHHVRINEMIPKDKMS